MNYIMIKMTKSRKVKKKNKIRIKKEYLIDVEKYKRIYCEIFFIGKQKVILFHKFRKNDWVFAANTLIRHCFWNP
jgi:hypothetical protein